MNAPTEAVRGRLQRYVDGDDDAIVGMAALKDVGKLLATTLDLEQSRLCGLLLWLRGGDDDLISALALLEPVWRADATRLPTEIAEYFAEFGPGPVRPTDAWQGPALVLTDHVRRTGDIEAAEIAVALHRRIVTAAPADETERNTYLANLAMAVHEHAELTGASDDYEEAVTLGREAMAAFARDDPRWAVPAGATAVALRRRSARTGRLADLDEAIDLARAAGRRSNLGVALTYRYEWTGEPADLAEALEILRGSREAPYLINLARALLISFEETGAVETLNEAIEAVEGLPQTTVASVRCNLLRTRFRFTGNADDLDRAVEAGRAAVADLPPGHPDHAGALNNLALAQHRLALRRDAPADLDEAIENLTVAIRHTGDHDPDRAGRLANLSDALLSRADRGGPGAAADIAAAVEHAQASVLAGAHHRRRASYLSGLGNALFAADDLDRAVVAHEQAVRACPSGAPMLASCLANLALTTLTRDPQRARAENRRAALTEAGPVEVRVRAAVRWGHWAAAAGRWDDASAGYTVAVNLLTDVSPATLPRDDQEFELARLGGIASDAAACALQAGDARTAVRLLELGRGIVLRHALPSAPDIGGGIDADEIPVAGPVVMVNVSRFRSDALVLSEGEVVVERLPRIDPEALRAETERFMAALASSDDASVTAVLEWLWDTVAGPVLDRLGFTGQHPLPRLWWCPTGLLAILPLHAAGRDGAGSVLDRVVSSITPSLWALGHARSARPPRDAARLLVIAPDVTALPAARAELRLLQELFAGRTITLADPDAAAIIAHRRIHVAGHAVADLTHPSRGGISRAGSPPITAGELSRLRQPDGEFAFLSACETARTGPALADETVHLASVLHVAGYRHVVATLWAVADRPALRVARDVYTELAADDDVDHTPAALHEAVRRLRVRYPRNPLAWAAYLHIGR